MTRTKSIINDLAAARTKAKDRPELIVHAIEILIATGSGIDPHVAAAVRGMKVDQWVYLRHTKTFAVFIDKKAENAFEVRALTTPLNELVDEPPLMFEAGVFEYMGLFVCDGLVLNPAALGPGYRAQFKAAYAAIRKSGRLHARAAAFGTTSL